MCLLNMMDPMAFFSWRCSLADALSQNWVILDERLPLYSPQKIGTKINQCVRKLQYLLVCMNVIIDGSIPDFKILIFWSRLAIFDSIIAAWGNWCKV